MLSLAGPAWLLGLLALPVIRWLHRGGRHRRAVAVAHLGLWQAAAQAAPAAGAKRPPDPAWRRRALFVALVVLALAEPHWWVRSSRITLWLDDSTSMLTREPAGTRLALALAEARAQLAAQPGAEVELRLLSEPWRAQPAGAAGLPAADALALGVTAHRLAPAPPPAALLAPERVHWLLTDGAHPALLRWPLAGGPERLIRVGSIERNVGLERVAVRRSAEAADRLDVLLQIGNGGTADEEREIVLDDGATEGARAHRRVAAGATEVLQFTLPATTRVRATLQPTDALTEDDAIELDLAPLRRRGVAIDPACPAALRAAIVAHPALTPAPMTALLPTSTPTLPPSPAPTLPPDLPPKLPPVQPPARLPAEAVAADAALLCSGREPDRPVPAIVVLGERLPLPLSATFQWPAAVAPTQRLALDAARWRVGGAITPRAGDSPLLAAAGEPLIVMRAGLPRRLETVLDFSGTAGNNEGELPLLVNWMFERLLEAPLLDAVVSVERPADAWRVAPTRVSGEGGADGGAATAVREPVAPATTSHDGSRLLVVLALAVLLWELAALARQWRRLSRVAPSTVPSIARSTAAPAAPSSVQTRPAQRSAKARAR